MLHPDHGFILWHPAVINLVGTVCPLGVVFMEAFFGKGLLADAVGNRFYPDIPKYAGVISKICVYILQPFACLTFRPESLLKGQCETNCLGCDGQCIWVGTEYFDLSGCK